MRVTANGISFNVEIEGQEGAPWIAFSNSLATNLHMWDPQAEALKGAYRVMRYDQRGHGQTDAPAGDYAMATLVEDVVALFDALKIERAHICGVSLGGVMALGMALLHPDRIDKAICCDSPGFTPPGAKAQWAERSAIAKEKGMEALVDPTLARWFPPETIAAGKPHIAKLAEQIRTTPANGFAGCAAALADHDYRSSVKKITRPLMFICGEKDAPPKIMREMAAETGAPYLEIPGAGHISNLDNPAMFTEGLLDFIKA